METVSLDENPQRDLRGGQRTTSNRAVNMFHPEQIELIAKWRVRRGINAPLSLPMKATAEERNCECPGKPQGCERRKCPRAAGLRAK